MAQIKSTIRSAPGPDGPFFVVTESDGDVTNVTSSILTIAAALDQAKTDHAAVILAGSLTFRGTVLTTKAD